MIIMPLVFFLLFRLIFYRPFKGFQPAETALVAFTILGLGVYFLSLLTLHRLSIGIAWGGLLLGFLFIWKKKRFQWSFNDLASILFLVCAGLFIPQLAISGWDEFCNWGITLKYLHLFGELPRDVSTVVFASYIHGISLLVNLFTYGLPFHEPTVYLATTLIILFFLTLALQISFYEVLQNKAPDNLILLFCFFLFVLMAHFCFGFFTLYMDPLMGLLLACCFLSLTTERLKSSLVLLFSAMPFLVFAKHTGLIFAILGLGYWCLFHFKKNRKWAAGIAIAGILMLISIKLSWDTFVSFHKIDGILKSVQHLNFSVIFQGLTDANGQIIFKQMIISLKDMQLFQIFFLSGLVLIFNKSIHRSERLKLGFVSVTSFLAYFFFLFFTYRFVFGVYEGHRVASFNRYLGAYLLGWDFFFVCFLIKHYWQPIQNFLSRSYQVKMATVLFLLVTMLYIDSKKAFIRPERVLAQNIKQQLAATLAGSQAQTMFIWQGSNGLEPVILKFEMFPLRSSYDAWSFGPPASEKDLWTQNLSMDDFANVMKGYRYLIVAKSDAKLWTHYGALFSEQTEGLFEVRPTSAPADGALAESLVGAAVGTTDTKQSPAARVTLQLIQRLQPL